MAIVTSILATDIVADSRTTINDNFGNLNVAKLEVRLRPKPEPIPIVPQIEQKRINRGNQKPRTDEHREKQSISAKKRWEKKRQEEAKTPPDADKTTQV